MEHRLFSKEAYAQTARQAAAEGCVLLRNEGRVLPLRPNAALAVFGRSQFHYYKSGTGSGGLVNTAPIPSILEALQASGLARLNQAVYAIYADWVSAHPFDEGRGWASEPWFQEEIPITEELAQAAAQISEAALILLNRTAGEDKDNAPQAGSYELTQRERQLLRTVCGAFEKVVILLNTGNIIDMKWVNLYRPASVLSVWQGGQEGSRAIPELLFGAVNPSGKLTDTIAADITDYPALLFLPLISSLFLPA